MTPFSKPQKDIGTGPHYTDLVKIAVERALADACIGKEELQQAVVGNLMADRSAGQRSLYGMGIFDIPVYNVGNACATGSNAIVIGRQLIEGGLIDCALAVGVEKMSPGSLGGKIDGQPTSMDLHLPVMLGKYPMEKPVPLMPYFFGNAGKDHMAKYGTTPKHFAMVGEKNHRHSANNPYSQFRDVYTLEQVEKATKVYDPLTKLQCSPTSDGAAAVILMSEEAVKKHGLEGQAIQIVGQCMRTDAGQSFDSENLHERSCIDAVGFPMAQACAKEVYRQAGKGPEAVQVIELHDCFSCNELVTYEALGLCGEGEGGKLLEAGDVTYGGRWVVNPSGGLISKGHPISATGLAQCSELCWQLRGEAGPRQVPNAKVGLQHNLGLGGACVITMYERPEQWASVPPKRAASGAMGFPESKL